MDTKDQKLENSFPYPGFEITEEAKRKAAYALNMCTVSVSQIIDYRDLNILEQEYEAILNNLNLEEIPKNEALFYHHFITSFYPEICNSVQQLFDDL